MDTLTFDIAAGETKPYAIGGSYFEVLDSTGPIDVDFIGYEGQNQTFKGALAGTYSKTPFTMFNLTSATAQTVKIMVTDRESGTRRVSGSVSINGTANVAVQGSLTVLDNGEVATIAEQAFMGGFIGVAAGAGLFPKAQIYNSGAKSMYIDTLRLATAAPGFVSLYWGTATLVGPVGQSTPKLSSSVSTTGARFFLLAAAAFLSGFKAVYVANGEAEIKFKEPIVIAPGQWLNFSHNVAAGTLSVQADWVEK